MLKMTEIEFDDSEVNFDDFFVPILRIEMDGVLCGVSRTPSDMGVERPDMFGLDIAIHHLGRVDCHFDYSQGVRAVFSHSTDLQHFHLPLSSPLDLLHLENEIGNRVHFVGESGILLYGLDQDDTASTLCSRLPKFMEAANKQFPDFELSGDPRFANFGHCHFFQKYLISRAPSALARAFGAKSGGVCGFMGQTVKKSMQKAREMGNLQKNSKDDSGDQKARSQSQSQKK